MFSATTQSKLNFLTVPESRQTETEKRSPEERILDSCSTSCSASATIFIYHEVFKNNALRQYAPWAWTILPVILFNNFIATKSLSRQASVDTSLSKQKLLRFIVVFSSTSGFIYFSKPQDVLPTEFTDGIPDVGTSKHKKGLILQPL